MSLSLCVSSDVFLSLFISISIYFVSACISLSLCVLSVCLPVHLPPDCLAFSLPPTSLPFSPMSVSLSLSLSPTPSVPLSLGHPLSVSLSPSLYVSLPLSVLINARCSRFKRLNPYLRSTRTQDRLSGLAVLAIHSDIPVSRSRQSRGSSKVVRKSWIVVGRGQS